MANVKIKVDPQETNGVKVNTTATAMTINTLGIEEGDPNATKKVRFAYSETDGYIVPKTRSIKLVNAIRESSSDKIIYFQSPIRIATTSADWIGYNVNEDYEQSLSVAVINRASSSSISEDDEYCAIVIIPESGHVVSYSTDGGETYRNMSPDAFGVVDLYSRNNITHIKLSKAEA